MNKDEIFIRSAIPNEVGSVRLSIDVDIDAGRYLSLTIVINSLLLII